MAASSWWSRLTIALVGLAAPLLLLEAALRLAGPVLPGYYRTGTHQTAHPDFGHFNRAGFVGWRRTPEYTAELRINSRGLRERELPYEKPAGTTRVLLLGDSYVEAYQVPTDQRVSSRLEALLGRDQPGTEVINAGISGFSTAQEWLFFRQEGHRYQPDLVVLVVYLGNDVRNNRVRLDNANRRRTTPYFAIRDGRLEQTVFPGPATAAADSGSDPLASLLRQSALYNVFETGVLEKVEYRDDEEAYSWGTNEQVFRTSYSGAWVEAWEVTAALLAALKGDVEARGARLVLVAAPRDLQVRSDDWDRTLREHKLSAKDYDLEKPNRLLQGIAERLDLPLIDLLPGFRAAEQSAPDGLFFRQDRHWNAAGHAAAASIIYSELARLGLWPPVAQARLLRDVRASAPAQPS